MSSQTASMAERLCEAFEDDGTESVSWPYLQQYERDKWARLANRYPFPPTQPNSVELDSQLKNRLIEIAAEFNGRQWFSAADEMLRLANNFPAVEHEADPHAWVRAEKAWAQDGNAAVNPYSHVYQPMSARVWRACIAEIRQQQGVSHNVPMPQPSAANKATDAQVTHVNGKSVPGDVAKIAAMFSAPRYIIGTSR